MEVCWREGHGLHCKCECSSADGRDCTSSSGRTGARCNCEFQDTQTSPRVVPQVLPDERRHVGADPQQDIFHRRHVMVACRKCAHRKRENSSLAYFKEMCRHRFRIMHSVRANVGPPCLAGVELVPMSVTSRWTSQRVSTWLQTCRSWAASTRCSRQQAKRLTHKARSQHPGPRRRSCTQVAGLQSRPT